LNLFRFYLLKGNPPLRETGRPFLTEAFPEPPSHSAEPGGPPQVPPPAAASFPDRALFCDARRGIAAGGGFQRNPSIRICPILIVHPPGRSKTAFPKGGRHD
jgi:hypothetical protein